MVQIHGLQRKANKGVWKWMCAVTKKDEIRNEHVSKSGKEDNGENDARGMVDAPVPGNSQRLRQKTRWESSCIKGQIWKVE